MKHIVFVLTVISAMLLSGCGIMAPATPAPAPAFERYALQQSSAGMAAPQALAMNGGSAYDAVQSNNNSPAVATDHTAAAQDRLVIQTADLTIVVKDVTRKMQDIEAMAKAMGGYVVSSNLDETVAADGTKVPEGAIVVRIPEEKLDNALNQVTGDVVDVQNETRTGVDVTKEHTDLQAQLTNLENTEQQLTLIMQKADKTEDVLAVFNQITQIRGQIDTVKGEIIYDEQSAALSAVSVRLIAQQSVQPIQIGGWEPQGDARNAVQALVNFFQGFVTFLIWLVLFALPAGLLILLPFYLVFLVVRTLLRRRRTKKVVASPSE